MMAFFTTISLNDKTVVFQFAWRFANFFTTTRTVSHWASIFLLDELRIWILWIENKQKILQFKQDSLQFIKKYSKVDYERLDDIWWLINCDFEVMMTFSAIIRFNSEALILQYAWRFVNYFATIRTMSHIHQSSLCCKKNMNVMNSE